MSMGVREIDFEYLRRNVTVIITCCDYVDFLVRTLPATVEVFRNVLIVTSPSDRATKNVAAFHSCRMIESTIWKQDNATFNKSAALNEALEVVRTDTESSWVLFLDADILIHSTPPHGINFDPNILYASPRRLCLCPKAFERFQAGELPLAEFPIEKPTIINGKVWGSRPTKNPAGLYGYFQLWNLKSNFGMKTMPSSVNASKFDVEFALSYPESQRMFIPNFDVIHLGSPEVNWDGRVAAHW